MFKDIVEIVKGLAVILLALLIVGAGLATAYLPIALMYNAVFGSGCLL